jgi:hypothetical protein
MKKERQIGIRIGLPAFFALELEEVYRHTEGPHRAFAFPDFVGLLVGMGLEQYRKGNTPAPATGENESLHHFDVNPNNLHDLIREYDKAIEQADPYDEVMELHEHEPRVRLVHVEDSI